jgi:lipoyl(octanoyl) transferase
MNFESWGEIPYFQSTQKQLELVSKRLSDELEDTLIFCSHPSVVTLGRASKKEDVINWTGECVESSRGGKATYHGPGQVVVYPIIKLKNKDIMGYLELLESVTVAVLKSFGLTSQKSREKNITTPNLIPTGVWIENKKIASIGIAVKRWVTYHGIAINLYNDPNAFKGINPCGFDSNIMTSVEEQLKLKVDREEFSKLFYSNFKSQYEKI